MIQKLVEQTHLAIDDKRKQSALGALLPLQANLMPALVACGFGFDATSTFGRVGTVWKCPELRKHHIAGKTG